MGSVTFLESQRAWASSLVAAQGDPLDLGPSGGIYRGKPRPFVLKEPERNLYGPVRAAAIEYFARNGITWWGGSRVNGHLLSSQVACVNHLFAWRDDPAAALRVLRAIDPEFDAALVVPSDAHAPGYVQFEAVSDTQHLNEGGLTRGAQCTSLDALMYARHRDGGRWLIAIEWKYTEAYDNEDKSLEGVRDDPEHGPGAVRQRRYNELIDRSTQLGAARRELCYVEPFYQLMRQTLWCEQRTRHRETERVPAERYLHVHVVPPANRELLDKRYPVSGVGMERTWRSQLRAPELYRVIAPEAFVAPALRGPEHADLSAYLRRRYWDAGRT